MSVLISCQNVSKAMTHKVLFKDLNLTLEDGERLGIIGPNGAGKSTFLKILAGLETLDEGQISYKKQLRIAYVEQQAHLDPELTVEETLAEVARRERLPIDSSQIEAQKILSRFGFEDFSAQVRTLSGGWKKRLAIACALLNSPDLVLFDEPTNHLDIRSVIWLEDFLKQAPFAWALVSHDRYFLDRTTQRILEIHSLYPGSHRCDKGNYTQFIESKAVYLQNLMREQQSLANKLRREDEWLVRQPKARGTKSKSRIDEAMRMKGDMQDMRQRLQQQSSDIDFQGSGRKSKQLMLLKDIGQSFGEKALFRGLNLVLSPGKIIGVLGDNGTGKSSLLKIMAGEIQPTAGTIQSVPQLELVYFDQGRESLQGEWTLKRALSDGQDNVIFQGRPIHVVSWARRFQFRSEQLDQPIGMLSGGEQAKVIISRLMLRKADVLLLDEPNNDLDIDTLETLEDSLDDFPGAIMIVSHDRYLLDRLCTGFLGLMRDGGIEAYASYDQWEQTLRDEMKSDSKRDREKGSAGNKARPTKSNKLSYKEQREYDLMEGQILEAEQALNQAQEAVDAASATQDMQALVASSAQLQSAQDQVERLYTRWTELEGKIRGDA